MLTYAERPNFGGKCRLQKIETTGNKTVLELFLHLIFILRSSSGVLFTIIAHTHLVLIVGTPFCNTRTRGLGLTKMISWKVCSKRTRNYRFY